MQKKSLVVKDNALINASYNLDLIEQRLILLAIVEARELGESINATTPLTIHADSYINHFDVSKQTAYEALKNACLKLIDRKFSYQVKRPQGIATTTSNWVSEVTYLDSTATVELIFTPAIVPMITALEEHFTSYELEQVSDLRSAYAVRLYELLISWRSVGKTPLIQIEEFRHKLGVEAHEYSRMFDLKKYVLDAAIKQINTHTDITAKYEQHKRGRSITGFSFTFKQKSAAKKLAPTKPKRTQITRKEAEEMAYLGEEWPDLLARLTNQYHIVDM